MKITIAKIKIPKQITLDTPIIIITTTNRRCRAYASCFKNYKVGDTINIINHK